LFLGAVRVAQLMPDDVFIGALLKKQIYLAESKVLIHIVVFETAQVKIVLGFYWCGFVLCWPCCGAVIFLVVIFGAILSGASRKWL